MIRRIDEKAAVIFVRLKRMKKMNYGAFIRLWFQFWPSDIANSATDRKQARIHNASICDETADVLFRKLFDAYSDMWGNRGLKAMVETHKALMTCETMPKGLFNRASALGYAVFKAKSNERNNRLSGYCIKEMKNGRVLYGHDYDLSIDDIYNIIKKEECKIGESKSER